MQSRLAKLRSDIDRHDSVYYRPGGKAIITDADYNALKEELRRLCPTDERLTRVGQPFSAEELRTKYTHKMPMGSLDNTPDGILGFPDWHDKVAIELVAEHPPLVASLKIDGSSIVAEYSQGELVRVLSRGNGDVGDDITANAVMCQCLPSSLPEPLTIQVRLEAILFADAFRQICDEDGIPEEDRSNARNVGNGLLGRSDGRNCDRLVALAHEVHGLTTATYDTYHAKLSKLQELGFTPVPALVLSDTTFQAYYDGVVATRDQLPYDIDGIVVILDNLKHQEHFVTTDPRSRLRPKYARAVKFPLKSSTTTIIDAVVTIGHTGAIIPTADLKKVRVGGVDVDSALLNNWDEIERLGVQIGDVVEVALAGEIIPKIIRVVSRGTDRHPIAEPISCPACGSATTRVHRDKHSASTYCEQKSNCPGARLGKIHHWIGSSKKGVGILDIGEETERALWECGLVANPADLYVLVPKSLAEVRLASGVRVGLSRATKICNNIAAKRELPLPVFLGSLGIDLLGRRRVVLLLEAAKGQLDTLDDWLDDHKLATLKIPGLGDTTRRAIREGIDANRELIARLLEVGVTIQGKQSVIAKSSTGVDFSGLSFCFTGFRGLEAEVEAAGGEMRSGVSKGLTFLVQMDATKSSNKTLKAESYGTKIISRDYLERALRGEVSLLEEEVPTSAQDQAAEVTEASEDTADYLDELEDVALDANA